MRKNPRVRPTRKNALAEAYEKEIEKLIDSEEIFIDESEVTEELNFDGDRYNDIHSINDGMLD